MNFIGNDGTADLAAQTIRLSDNATSIGDYAQPIFEKLLESIGCDCQTKAVDKRRFKGDTFHIYDQEDAAIHINPPPQQSYHRKVFQFPIKNNYCIARWPYGHNLIMIVLCCAHNQISNDLYIKKCKLLKSNALLSLWVSAEPMAVTVIGIDGSMRRLIPLTAREWFLFKQIP